MSFLDRDDDTSTRNLVLGVVAGAVAGVAIGVLVSKKFGGLDGLLGKFQARRRLGRNGSNSAAFDEMEDDAFENEGFDGVLEERVLEAYRGDPVLSERGIDIGEVSDGVIELTGSVDTEREAELAVAVARGVPGVETVVNRLQLAEDESRVEEAVRRVAQHDDALTEAHWEGRTIGIGRRQQGTSQDLDRHQDPKVPLQERWTTADQALREAADDTPGFGDRGVRGDSRGVPAADRPPQAEAQP